MAYDYLTQRQLELLALYASGDTLEEIAAKKYLSYSAVKQTLQRARQRTGARTLTHLCVICASTGLIVQQRNSSYIPVPEEMVVDE